MCVVRARGAHACQPRGTESGTGRAGRFGAGERAGLRGERRGAGRFNGERTHAAAEEGEHEGRVARDRGRDLKLEACGRCRCDDKGGSVSESAGAKEDRGRRERTQTKEDDVDADDDARSVRVRPAAQASVSALLRVILGALLLLLPLFEPSTRTRDTVEGRTYSDGVKNCAIPPKTISTPMTRLTMRLLWRTHRYQLKEFS